MASFFLLLNTTLASFSLPIAEKWREKTYFLPKIGHIQVQKRVLPFSWWVILYLCFAKIKQLSSAIQAKDTAIERMTKKCHIGLFLKSLCFSHTMKATVYGKQQSWVGSLNKYKHSFSTEIASPWFNYRSCQSRWKNMAPDKARPHSLISHGPFSHPEMHRHPSAKSQIKPWDGGTCPKHPGNFTVSSCWMPLTPQKWGLFNFDNCPWFFSSTRHLHNNDSCFLYE